MSNRATDVQPERPNRLRGNTREAVAAKRLGIGVVCERFGRWDSATKKTVWVNGGVFLSDAELADLQARIRSDGLLAAAGKASDDSQIKPPHDAEKKVVRAYRLLIEELVRAGVRITSAEQLSTWSRANDFYGLEATGEPPEVEIAASHAGHIADLATSRSGGDLLSSETESEYDARKHREARARKRTPSRGYVKGKRP